MLRLARSRLAVFLLLGAVCVLSAQSAAAEIIVERPWARASAGAGGNAAVFMTLRNAGGTADRLIGAETPAAGMAGLHGHSRQDNFMRMRPVESIEVPAEATVELAPGGLHVMLMQVKTPLREGDRFALTLQFERGDAVTLEVPVAAIGALGPPAQ